MATIKEMLTANTADILEATELLKVLGDREGQFVWKQLTAEGGDFVNFVVADTEDAYPDGGMQDGYWYEMVKGGGEYVWVKYETETLNEITVTNPSFTITVPANAPVGAVTMGNINGFADHLDDIDLMFFDGFEGMSGSYKMFFDYDENWSTMFLINRYGSQTSNNGVLNMGYADGVLKITSKQTWGSAAMTARMSYSGNKTIKLKTPKIVPTTRVGYVFADDTSEYPDFGVKDGCFYMKIPKVADIGCTKIAVDKFTLSADTYHTNILHSLCEKPKFAILKAKTKKNYSNTSSIYVERALFNILDSETMYGCTASGYNSSGAEWMWRYGQKQSQYMDANEKYFQWYGYDSAISGMYAYLAAGVEYTLITMA